MGPSLPARVRLPAGFVAALFGSIVGLVAAPLRAEPAAEVPSSAEDPDLEAPVILEGATIDYPEELLLTDPPPAGQVLLKLVVGVDGVPAMVEVERGVHPRLDALALAAVRELRYRPARY
ncbi:MAG TPA: hypothetical protein ENJ18_14525, partial [Nannocystis exedens]|nr:hypothetical protein [Nannocystis exedens]